MRRFFIAPDALSGESATISGTDAHHLRTVLRLEQGAELILVAEGKEYLAQVRAFEAEDVLCTIIEERESTAEPPLEVILLQGLPKGDKVDLIVQKAVEIGVAKIVLLEGERSVAKLAGTRGEKKLARWQRIAYEAAKQSQRSVVPEIEGVFPLISWLKKEQFDEDTLFLVPWEEEEKRGIGEVLAASSARRVVILIGPEGGLTKAEVEAAKEEGAVPVTLGPRILRTETAAVVAAALVLYELGDLN